MISHRLLSYVGTEMSEALREKAIRSVIANHDSDDLIEPLQALIYDRQKIVRECAIRLMCSITNAAPYLKDYLFGLIQQLSCNGSQRYAVIASVNIIAEIHPTTPNAITYV